MSVYDLDIKGLRKTFMKFNKTLYGRTVFFLAYIIPFFMFGMGLALLIAGLIQGCTTTLLDSARVFGAFVITFVIGNIYFYSEIRKFCKYEDHKKK
jgi:uncharacterized membrane protein (DUF485 family)